MKTSMRKMSLLLIVAAVSCVGGPLTEGDSAQVAPGKLKYRSYDVLFTNPDCGVRDPSGDHAVTGPYDLVNEVATVGGGTRSTAHRNAYCFGQYDSNASGIRPSSPLYRLRDWISHTNAGDEIFAAYFSFSNAKIVSELSAAAQRGVKITFVKDSGQDDSAAQQVKTASPDNVTILERGNENDVGYHHNKFLMVNPAAAGPHDTADADGETYIKLVFSSGNMSSGTVLHQENWHFIEVARSSFFAQSHVCVMNALRDEQTQAYRTRTAFTEYLDTCRASIQSLPETDISAFFMPDKNDSSELRRQFAGAIAAAGRVDVAAHRFSLFYLQSGLKDRISHAADRVDQGLEPDFRARLVADDDLYWLYPRVGEHQNLGDNMPFENTNVWKLRSAARENKQLFEARFVETNSDGHLLHHNKFVIALDRNDGQPDAVVCGAANFTNDAFWYGGDSQKNNFENVYYITIPQVVQAMEHQFEGFFRDQELDSFPTGQATPPRATPVEEMPVEYTHARDPGAH
jgi:hypothetical protein